MPAISLLRQLLETPDRQEVLLRKTLKYSHHGENCISPATMAQQHDRQYM